MIRVVLITCIIFQAICMIINIRSLIYLSKKKKEIKDAIRINKGNLRE